MDIKDSDIMHDHGDTYSHRHMSNHGIRGGYWWPSGPWHSHNADGTGQKGHIHSPREQATPTQDNSNSKT